MSTRARETTMAEQFDENGNARESEPVWSGMNRWLLAAIVALVAVAGIAMGYGYRQQILADHLTAQQSMANATINEMQGQLNTVTSKLNEVTAPQQAAGAAAEQAKTAHAPGAKKADGKKTSVGSKQLKELQAKLDDQQKQLKDTQDLVAKNRADLEGSLSSTKDELNGSIAKTHEELVVLQKRGERNYFEFDLTKSKQFQRFGPLTLSLRRADAKHMNYDVAMVVDDNQLSKKRVNLYEPIWIHTENESQPVQVVVNKIGKNFVHGYISAPKYRPSEFAASGTAAATVTPVAEHPQPPPGSESRNSEATESTGIIDTHRSEFSRASTVAPCFFIGVNAPSSERSKLTR